MSADPLLMLDLMHSMHSTAYTAANTLVHRELRSWATLPLGHTKMPCFPARHVLPKASRNSASEVRCVREEKIEEVLAIPCDSSFGDKILCALQSLRISSLSLQLFLLATSAYFPCE